VSGFAFYKTLEIISIAPLEITLSLVYGLSPAMFPIPQITYSTTSWWSDCKRWMKWERTSFSIRLLTWSEVPDAILVKHHAASNYNFGNSWCKNYMNTGIKFASITAYIGGVFSIESNFLKPIHAKSLC
jgi:hypothetical protein